MEYQIICIKPMNLLLYIYFHLFKTTGTCPFMRNTEFNFHPNIVHWAPYNVAIKSYTISKRGWCQGLVLQALFLATTEIHQWEHLRESSAMFGSHQNMFSNVGESQICFDKFGNVDTKIKGIWFTENLAGALYNILHINYINPGTCRR